MGHGPAPTSGWDSMLTARVAGVCWLIATILLLQNVFADRPDGPHRVDQPCCVGDDLFVS